MSDKVKIIIAVLCLAFIFTLYNSVYIVTEKDQVVVFQFGAPVKISTDPGLHFKTPFLQSIRRFDKRILEWDGDPAEIPIEGKKIAIDTFARWKITEPQIFYERVVDEDGAYSRIDDIVNGVVRDEISISILKELIADEKSLRSFNDKGELFDYSNQVSHCELIDSSDDCEKLKCIWVIDENSDREEDKGHCQAGRGRSDIVNEIEKEVQLRLNNSDIGVTFVDFQIKRINYTSTVREKVYQDIRAKQTKEATKLRKEGIRLGKQIVASADAEAFDMKGESFNQDTIFFKLWKGLKTRRLFFDKKTQLFMSDSSNVYPKIK